MIDGLFQQGPGNGEGGGAGTMARPGAQAWALCSPGDNEVVPSLPRRPICVSAHRVSFPGLLALPSHRCDPSR